MATVAFYDCDHDPGVKLTYSVICARYGGKWIYVRHHLRSSYEIAGGHIEPGESSHDAACRELKEETGAVVFSIECVATYSVTMKGITGWGRLYLADVREIGPVPDMSEIAEVIFDEGFPEPNTHPKIQPELYRKVLVYIRGENH